MAIDYLRIARESAEQPEDAASREPTLRSLYFMAEPPSSDVSDLQTSSTLPRSKTRAVYFRIELDNPWDAATNSASFSV